MKHYIFAVLLITGSFLVASSGSCNRRGFDTLIIALAANEQIPRGIYTYHYRHTGSFQQMTSHQTLGAGQKQQVCWIYSGTVANVHVIRNRAMKCIRRIVENKQ